MEILQQNSVFMLIAIALIVCLCQATLGDHYICQGAVLVNKKQVQQIPITNPKQADYDNNNDSLSGRQLVKGPQNRDDKAKLCEVICKNCPAEGGKMCNCDTYALSSDEDDWILDPDSFNFNI